MSRRAVAEAIAALCCHLGIDRGRQLRDQWISKLATALGCSAKEASELFSCISEWKFERLYCEIAAGRLVLEGGKLVNKEQRSMTSDEFVTAVEALQKSVNLSPPATHP